jgi:hypothetical protein
MIGRRSGVLLAFVATVLLVSLVSSPVFALPTPAKSGVLWDYDETAIAGFFIYFRSDVAGTTYNDTNKFQIPNTAARQALIVDITPQRGRLCIVATAYDAAGQESTFSNEICDFFGLKGPFNLRFTTP